MNETKMLKTLSYMSIGYVALSQGVMWYLDRSLRRCFHDNHELTVKNEKLFGFAQMLLNKAVEENPGVLHDPEVNQFLVDWEFDNISTILKEDM